MTTIINTPPASTEDSSSGLIVGIIFGALIVILLIFFGVRYYRGQAYVTSNAPSTQAAIPTNTTVNITTPTAPPATTGTGNAAH